LNKCFFAQILSICSKSAAEKWITQKEGAGDSSTVVTVKYKLSIKRPSYRFSITQGNTVILLSDTYGQILLSVQNQTKMASEYQTENKGTTQVILI